ncbi:MAG: HAMP domain-containing histidine kinase [Alphaproteobacteria bacterium]|nr:HAMP domain-containing histidine kinase [Alphaproteobacteria bacterium]
MRKLYLRIYLAVLASIALSVILTGIAAAIFAGENRFRPRDEFFAAAVAVMLPPVSAPAAEQQRALERWQQLSGYDLVLLDRQGVIIARAGDDFSPRMRETRWRAPFNQQQVALDDGRTLYARPGGGPPKGWRGLGLLGVLALVGLAVAISAWPVVRRLTRDLEKLERGVAAFGSGNLAARVDVRGKDEVARLAATFNDTAARIETLMRVNRSLLANASHELRSPLARLRMAVETLGPDVAPATREEIARNVRELDELIDEILLASRFEAGAAGTMRPEGLDLRALAAEECARLGFEFHSGEGAQTPFNGDPRLIRRLMRNLLENARRYGGGKAEALLYASHDRMRFDVGDRGPGVPEAERERIFEPFYRPAGASEASGGVGLGLALVRQIARSHGGEAQCLARDGGGACFRAEFPLHGMPGGSASGAA